jgi:predicted ribosome quality control (RQC) complex YloA/Tae2 family protein
MLTDWVLIRRLARELDDRLRGAKVRDAGLLPDGRIALALRSRKESVLLAVDAFGSPPLVTIESGELGINPEPGFVRALATGLRDMTLTGVRARRGDRLVRLSFAARSRFGVGEHLELYLELVPRFGNLVLVKGDTVVSAAKEFSLAQNGARAVQAGLAYAAAPARPGVSLLPKALAQTGLDEAAFVAFAEGEDAMREPLYVYRRDGALLQAHLVALPDFPEAACTREPSILAIFDELRVGRIGRGERERAQRRRAAANKRLDERERKLRDELAKLEAKRVAAAQRDDLRAEGEAIYATLHELGDAARDEAKERAATLFARYKKLGAALPHVDERERTVRAGLEAVEALRWETERSGDGEIDDVEAAIAQLEPHRIERRAEPSKKRRRAPLEYRTPAGSRIIVGRSPVENADVTFRLARPHDLWFHTQGIPGAHVILARDDRDEAPPQDIETAAALAAFHSKGHAAAKVAVDYTHRKHVRKQRDAPPGLVWYTHAKTILVAPQGVA